jgi:2-octaprenylphenol hydroxylase
MTNGAGLSVIIVGGGPVGLGVAALLARSPYAAGLRVRVLEPRPAARWRSEELDLRVYALSRASQRILDFAGVWDAIAASRAQAYRRMVVWEGDWRSRIGGLAFDCAEIGEPDLGHIVEDCLIRARLTEQLRATPGVELSFGVEVASLRAAPRSIQIETQVGERIEAQLLIAADGSASPVRERLGLPIFEVSYEQAAIVTHVATEKAHGETAWQRFLPTGPIALLPLSDGRSSVIWSTRQALARELQGLDDAALADALSAATQQRLGSIVQVAERASFPLRAVHARRYCTDRAVLIGDAAHTVHPLAGQGMNLGLLDAAVLAEVIEGALAAGEDPGDLRVLRRYERKSKGRNLKTLLLMDALHRAFAWTSPLLTPLRAGGVGIVDSTPAAKRVLMRHALGLVADLPRAARPPAA